MRTPWRRKAWWLIGGLLLVVLAMPVLLYWGLQTEAGTRWTGQTLQRFLSSLEIVGARGSLLQGPFEADRITWRDGKGRQVVMFSPRWKNARLYWAAHTQWKIGLHLTQIHVKSVQVDWPSAPKTSGPTADPDWQLPLALTLDDIQIDRIQSALIPEGVDGHVVSQLVGKASLQSLSSTPAGVVHRIELTGLKWQVWHLKGTANIHWPSSVLPAALRSGRLPQLQVQAEASSPLDRIEARVTGPLNALKLSGQLMVSGRGTASQLNASAQPPQAVDVQAELTLQEAWPVTSASIQSQRLDLQRLNALWPQTALSGQVRVLPARLKSVAEALPASLRVEVDLGNDLAGPWDSARVPVLALSGHAVMPLRHVAAAKDEAASQASSSAVDWSSVWRAGEIDSQITVPLQRSARAAKPGQIKLTGHWDMDQRANTALAVSFVSLETRSLHGRAPALSLGGSIRIDGLRNQQWQIAGAVDGMDAGDRLLPQPVKAQWDAVWAPQQLEVSRLQLTSSGSSAALKGRWQQQDDGTSTSTGQLNLQNLDPAVWAPWPRPSGDTRQKTRLNGQAQWHLRLPLMEHLTNNWMQAQGTVSGHLSDSELLGVHTQGHWQVQAQPRQWQINAQLQANENRLKADAVWPLPASSKGQGLSQWRQGVGLQAKADIDAPALAVLQPWLKLAGLMDLRGQLQGQATLQVPAAGRWQTQGQLQSASFQANWQDQPISWQGLRAQWQVDATGRTPWKVSATAEQGRWDAWQIQQWQAQLDGNAPNHRWAVTGRVDLPPRPLPSGRVFKESVRAQWSGQGQWQTQVSGLGRWVANTDVLRVTPMTLDVVPTWVDARPFELTLHEQAQGWQWRLGATRLSVMDLAFDVEQAQGAWGSSPAIAAKARLLPVQVAQLLSRWQPKAGWGGDLSVAGQFEISQSAGQPWQVLADLNRQSGDLTLSDRTIEGAKPQALGLKQLRLQVRANDGLWSAQHTLEGQLLGRIVAHATVRPRNRWDVPGSADPLQGQIQAEISDARSLAAWAPAGWRLAGQMQGQAQLGGTLGAPQYEGTVTGRQLGVQNALLGVYLSEGNLAARLKGKQAVIDELHLKGGNPGERDTGDLFITGQASLEGEPQANLKARAARFLLLNRADRRARLSGDVLLQIKGQDNVKIEGTLGVDEGLIDVSRIDTPTVGDDVNVVNRPDQLDDMPATGDAALVKRQWYVNLGLNLGQQLRLKGRGLDSELQGELKMTTPNGRPQVHGTVKAVDGTYASYGQKLSIERGTLSFTGPVNNPRLDIKAMRPQSPLAESADVEVGVLITGTAIDPRIRLYSEPPMSETEKLSWLVLGRGPSGLGVADIGLLQTAASALISGEGGTPDDTLLGMLGLDELSVRQTDGAVRDTIVTVGKQVSRRWYLGYERSLNAAIGTWQAIYRAAQRFSVRLQTGDDDAIDLIWLWRGDE